MTVATGRWSRDAVPGGAYDLEGAAGAGAVSAGAGAGAGPAATFSISAIFALTRAMPSARRASSSTRSRRSAPIPSRWRHCRIPPAWRYRESSGADRPRRPRRSLRAGWAAASVRRPAASWRGSARPVSSQSGPCSAEHQLADLTADEHAHDSSQNPDHNGRVHRFSPMFGNAAQRGVSVIEHRTRKARMQGGYLPADNNFSFSFLP